MRNQASGAWTFAISRSSAALGDQRTRGLRFQHLGHGRIVLDAVARLRSGDAARARHDGLVLTDDQRRQYAEQGWIAVPGLVDDAWLDRLASVTDEFVEQSRTLTESNVVFDLDAGHSADEPRLRRLSSPTDLHETYWEFASQSAIVDVAVDLLGPDVKFHHSKLNFKAPHGGEEVKWHQDIQFWPHTNYDLLTIGVFLEDVEPGMGEVGFVPGSHDGPLYDLYDGDRWVGALGDDDVARAGVERAEYPVGPGRDRSRCTTAAPCTAPRQPLRPRPSAAAPDLRRRRRARRTPTSCAARRTARS